MQKIYYPPPPTFPTDLHMTETTSTLIDLKTASFFFVFFLRFFLMLSVYTSNVFQTLLVHTEMPDSAYIPILRMRKNVIRFGLRHFHQAFV